MFVVTKNEKNHYERRELGTADKLTREYFWDKSNGYSVTMRNDDAENIQAGPHADEFTFVKEGEDAPAIVVEDGEITQ